MKLSLLIKPQEKVLKAKILEQAVVWQNKYLLFTTDDVPFEEFLTIYLLDHQFNIINSATIGYIYATGTFEYFRIIAPNEASFSFLGEDNRWHITLLPHFVFKLSPSPFYGSFFRRFKFKQHFILPNK